ARRPAKGLTAYRRRGGCEQLGAGIRPFPRQNGGGRGGVGLGLRVWRPQSGLIPAPGMITGWLSEPCFPWSKLVGRVGLEPTTYGLKAFFPPGALFACCPMSPRADLVRNRRAANEPPRGQHGTLAIIGPLRRRPCLTYAN